MRSLFFVSILVGILFSTTIALGNNFEDTPENVMQYYFNALKNGDTETIITLLTDPILNNRRLLLEKNTAYPEHLRNYYQNANMFITDKTLSDDGNVCTITTNIFFESGGNPLIIQFYLKNTSEGWKISEEFTME